MASNINPLQFQAMNPTVPQMDFSSLGQIGEVYRKAQMRNELQGLAATGQQPSLEDISKVALKYGDMDTFKGAAQLAQTNAYQLATLGLKGREVTINERLANKKDAPDLTDIYDPATGQPQKALVNRAAGTMQPLGGVKNEKKDLSIGDITKLSEEGGKFSAISGLKDSFKPEFGGWGLPGIGDLANTLTNNMPNWIPAADPAKAKSRDEGAAWWKEYARQKNVVRNELFGSALTPGEQRAWEAADINPAMNPDQIKKNLKLQNDITQGAIKRKASAAIEAGYRPEQISKAYGVDLGSLGVPGRGQAGAPTANLRPTPAPLMEEARKAIAAGKDPAGVRAKLEAAGFNPSGI